MLDYTLASVKDYFYKIINDAKKPQPDGITKLAAELKIEKKDIVYIGDMVTDAKFAQNAGVEFLFANWGFGTEKSIKNYPVLKVINSFSEILDAL